MTWKRIRKQPKIGQGTTGKQAVPGMGQRRGLTKAIPVSKKPLIQEDVEAGAIICIDDRYLLCFQHGETQFLPVRTTST